MSNPYKPWKVYGPYKRRDGRQHVILYWPDGTQKTVSYPKYIVECSIGRVLDDDFEVHHIDGDFTNNALSNLQVIEKKLHAAQHQIKYTGGIYTCVLCGKEFTLTARQERYRAGNSKRGAHGPFCSKTCVGKYGKLIQSANQETD